jgi:hypothetical protein
MTLEIQFLGQDLKCGGVKLVNAIFLWKLIDQMKNMFKKNLSEQSTMLIEQSKKEGKAIPLTQIYDRLFSWFGTGTSLK